MKVRNIFLLIAVVAFSFTACEEDEALTPNPTFNPEATGEDPKIPTGGNGSGSGSDTTGNEDGLPQDFLADTTAQNRVAVLEDFTGVRCVFCPDGHDIASQIESSLGDDFITIAVHNSGSYSAPSTGWQNFETQFGDALKNQADISGYPAGTMNRMKADTLGASPQMPDGLAMGRNSWPTAANTAITLESPVNIGAKASISDSTLTVDIDLYYTDNESSYINKLNVALLQDGINSRQSGGTPDPDNYIQNHVLRHYLTGQWGEEITQKSKNSYTRKSYTYKIPPFYNGSGPDGGGSVVFNDLKVVVFMSRDKKEIISATEIDIQ